MAALFSLPSLLVVEDSQATQVLIRFLLEQEYDIDIASRAVEALNFANARRYDAVLMDIELGEERSGVDVLYELRKLPGYETVPVIACTAHALMSDQRRYLDLGFDAYLSKPFRLEALQHLLESLLKERPPMHRSEA